MSYIRPRNVSSIETRNIKKRYTLIIVLSEDLSEVLLQHKNRGPYPGTLNAVGGSVEITDVTAFHGALRELKEETSLDVDFYDENGLVWLTTNIYPSGVELWVGYTVAKKEDVIQLEDEELEWFPVDAILEHKANSSLFAGEGNLQYYINAALEDIKANGGT